MLLMALPQMMARRRRRRGEVDDVKQEGAGLRVFLIMRDFVA